MQGMSKNKITYFLSTARGKSINRFVIFYSIAVAFNLILNWQVFSYGYPALEKYPIFQVMYTIGFCILAPLFVIARVIERYYKNRFVSFILWIGSFWLGMLMYLVLGILSIYIFLFVSYAFSINAYDFHSEYQIPIGLFLGFLSFCMAAWGWYNAHHPRIRKLEYTFPKGSGL